MNTLLGFGILILVIINFVLYHKIVDTIYFDLPGGCATELFRIAIFTAFEIAIIKGIILKIFSIVGAVLGFVGKLIFIILVASIVIFVVWKILQVVKGKANIESGDKGDVDFAQSNQDVLEKNISNVEMCTCTNCGKAIKNGAKFCQFCGHGTEGNT